MMCLELYIENDKKLNKKMQSFTLLPPPTSHSHATFVFNFFSYSSSDSESIAPPPLSLSLFLHLLLSPSERYETMNFPCNREGNNFSTYFNPVCGGLFSSYHAPWTSKFFFGGGGGWYHYL